MHCYYRSDVLGQFMPMVGIDWSQTGVAHLFSAIKVCCIPYSNCFLIEGNFSHCTHNSLCMRETLVVLAPQTKIWRPILGPPNYWVRVFIILQMQFKLSAIKWSYPLIQSMIFTILQNVVHVSGYESIFLSRFHFLEFINA